jgi:hypothetical protein
MPTVAMGTGSARPKYSFDGKSLLVYRGEKAYASFEDERAPNELAHYFDVRVLTDAEGREFERSLPLPFYTAPPTVRRRSIRLGDAIAWVTARMGIEECEGCRRRKGRLNKISVSWWWARGRWSRFRKRTASGKGSDAPPPPIH